jgi:transmembrane sensor
MKKELADKFFNNQVSNLDVNEVLEWFETSEGREYLNNKLDSDKNLMSKKELKELAYEFDSEKLYRSIQEKIRYRRDLKKKRWDWVSNMVKVAAVIAVIITSSLLVIKHETDLEEHYAEQIEEPIFFQTGHDQHREITLADGTMIRLNGNSELMVSGNYMQDTREITLAGEAYFDVAHDPDRKFIIHANQSAIEVLGTAFNVRSYSGDNNVQVAVIDGTVSFRNISNENAQVLLNKGDFAYMDVNKTAISVDNVAVENYLSWKSGRLVFQDLSLNQVCNQLGRLYNVVCEYENENIKQYHVTARFSDESLEKALEVLALTLKIGYEKEGNKVKWIDTDNT